MSWFVWALIIFIAAGVLCAALLGALLHQKHLAAKLSMPELSDAGFDATPFRVEVDEEGGMRMVDVEPAEEVSSTPTPLWTPAMLSLEEENEVPDEEKDTDSSCCSPKESV